MKKIMLRVFLCLCILVALCLVTTTLWIIVNTVFCNGNMPRAILLILNCISGGIIGWQFDKIYSFLKRLN